MYSALCTHFACLHVGTCLCPAVSEERINLSRKALCSRTGHPGLLLRELSCSVGVHLNLGSRQIRDRGLKARAPPYTMPGQVPQRGSHSRRWRKLPGRLPPRAPGRPKL